MLLYRSILFQQLGPSTLQRGTFLRRQTVQTVLGDLVQQGVDLDRFVPEYFDAGRRWNEILAFEQPVVLADAAAASGKKAIRRLFEETGYSQMKIR